MRTHRSGSGSLALAAVAAVVSLTPARAAAQTPAAQEACPAEPALFRPCAIAKAKTFDPPRTPDGRPDLQGFWRNQSAGTENIEEHPKTFDDNGGKSLIVDPPDGKVPYQPWAAAQRKEHREKYIDPNVPCFPSGVPRTMYVPTSIQILQPAGHVVVLLERAHTYRVIPTGPRSAVGHVLLWQGRSQGRWEGNTLVVDVTDANAKTFFDQAANFYSDAVHMVERFTLIDPDTIHYEVTVEDRNVYTRPWTATFPIRRIKDKGYQLLEEACHEGEEDTQHLLNIGQRYYPGVTANKEQ